MRLTLCIFLLIALTCAQKLTPGSSVRFTVQRPEGQREFWVWAPPNYVQNSTDSFPLLLSFHGLGGDYNPGSMIVKLAMKNNYILAAGRGTPSVSDDPKAKGKRSWNAGVCCSGGDPGPDDVEFTRNMVAKIKSMAKIGSMFVMGGSNGGMMADRLGCEAGELWTAVVSNMGSTVVGNGGSDAITHCDSTFGKSSFSYLHLHGLDDFVVPWQGTTNRGEADFPPTLQVITGWANRLECNGGVESNYRNTLVTNLLFKGCRNGGTVELLTGAEQAHNWWNIPGFAPQNYMFDFFNNVPKKQN